MGLLKSVVLASMLALAATTTVSFAQQADDCGYDYRGRPHCGGKAMDDSQYGPNPSPNYR
jgi:Spy/CpxP family protein refolding chaperone